MREKDALGSFTLCVFAVITVLYSCRATERTGENQVASLQHLVKSRLGPKYTIEYNVSKTYALGQQQRDGDHVGRGFKYIVVRLVDNVIIREGSFALGYIKWIDDKTLETVSTVANNGQRPDEEKRIIRLDSDQN